jgi:hypothetical protein
LTTARNAAILRADETLSTLPKAGRLYAFHVRQLRHGNLRHEATAVLLGHLPI